MAEFAYGPVELYLVGFEGDRLDPGTVEALEELVDGGEVRLLDLVIVSREPDGSVRIVEIEDEGEAYGFGVLELEQSGLVGAEDVDDFAELIPPGTSAALAAFELLWAKKLASRFAEGGGVVLSTERIPAPVVNQLLAEASGEEG
ncbi:DUF6325 family protein [Agromyces sp. NPDC058104]|uniref:DUF6325 family protein n=1 Tax=Agromyces sp. NPDC058104 TaxID=3346342 RepID=UPI0036DA4215